MASKAVAMKPFRAWVVVQKETGRFVVDGGIGLSRADATPMDGERRVRVLVTEVPRGE